MCGVLGAGLLAAGVPVTVGGVRRLWQRRAPIVLLIAAAWGQAKTVLLLALGALGADWPAWALWVAGTVVSQVLTLGCYLMTTWAERRMGCGG